jgi:hypothetical protein
MTAAERSHAGWPFARRLAAMAYHCPREQVA